jgi:RNA polymerase sigma factor (TIGR02999 family)
VIRFPKPTRATEGETSVPEPGDITQLLIAHREGDPDAFERLLPLVYAELRLAAPRQLRKRSAGRTLDTTALVHEAYLKLVDHHRVDWRDRGHFLAVASTAMRHILVDAARRRTAQKRGGDEAPGTFRDTLMGVEGRAFEILALDRALEYLTSLDDQLGRLVELRFFGGLTVEETAEVLGIGERTVKRGWQKARAILYRTLDPGDGGGAVLHGP